MNDALVKRIAKYLAINNSTSAGIPDDPAKAAARWPSYIGQALEIAEMVNAPGKTEELAIEEFKELME